MGGFLPVRRVSQVAGELATFGGWSAQFSGSLSLLDYADHFSSGDRIQSTMQLVEHFLQCGKVNSLSSKMADSKHLAIVQPELNNPRDSDLEIYVNHRVIYAHEKYLRRVSSHFRQLLSSTRPLYSNLSHRRILVLGTEFDLLTIKTYLRFLYTSRVDLDRCPTYPRLYALALRYGESRLKLTVESWLTKRILIDSPHTRHFTGDEKIRALQLMLDYKNGGIVECFDRWLGDGQTSLDINLRNLETVLGWTTRGEFKNIEEAVLDFLSNEFAQMIKRFATSANENEAYESMVRHYEWIFASCLVNGANYAVEMCLNFQLSGTCIEKRCKGKPMKDRKHWFPWSLVESVYCAAVNFQCTSAMDTIAQFVQGKVAKHATECYRLALGQKKGILRHQVETTLVNHLLPVNLADPKAQVNQTIVAIFDLILQYGSFGAYKQFKARIEHDMCLLAPKLIKADTVCKSYNSMIERINCHKAECIIHGFYRLYETYQDTLQTMAYCQVYNLNFSNLASSQPQQAANVNMAQYARQRNYSGPARVLANQVVKFSISQKMAPMLNLCENSPTDLTVRAQGGTCFQVHTRFLDYVSDYFHRELTSRQDSYSSEAEFDLTQYHARTVNLYLGYLYGHSISLTVENYAPLFRLACELDENRLEKRVTEFIVNDLVFSTYSIAKVRIDAIELMLEFGRKNILDLLDKRVGENMFLPHFDHNFLDRFIKWSKLAPKQLHTLKLWIYVYLENELQKMSGKMANSFELVNLGKETQEEQEKICTSFLNRLQHYVESIFTHKASFYVDLIMSYLEKNVRWNPGNLPDNKWIPCAFLVPLHSVLLKSNWPHVLTKFEQLVVTKAQDSQHLVPIYEAMVMQPSALLELIEHVVLCRLSLHVTDQDLALLLGDHPAQSILRKVTQVVLRKQRVSRNKALKTYFEPLLKRLLPLVLDTNLSDQESVFKPRLFMQYCFDNGLHSMYSWYLQTRAKNSDLAGIQLADFIVEKYLKQQLNNMCFGLIGVNPAGRNRLGPKYLGQLKKLYWDAMVNQSWKLAGNLVSFLLDHLHFSNQPISPLSWVLLQWLPGFYRTAIEFKAKTVERIFETKLPPLVWHNLPEFFQVFIHLDYGSLGEAIECELRLSMPTAESKNIDVLIKLFWLLMSHRRLVSNATLRRHLEFQLIRLLPRAVREGKLGTYTKRMPSGRVQKLLLANQMPTLYRTYQRHCGLRYDVTFPVPE